MLLATALIATLALQGCEAETVGAQLGAGPSAVAPDSGAAGGRAELQGKKAPAKGQRGKTSGRATFAPGAGEKTPAPTPAAHKSVAPSASATARATPPAPSAATSPSAAHTPPTSASASAAAAAPVGLSAITSQYGKSATPSTLDYENTVRPQLDGRNLAVLLDPTRASQRSEVLWGFGPSALRFDEGDEVTSTFTTNLNLHGTATSKDQWLVVWQLLGPMADGRWPAPSLALNVNGGKWNLLGGRGADGTGALSTAPAHLAFHDGESITWTIRVKLSSDPSKGSVDVDANGKSLVRGWRPPSGTLYHGQSWVNLKTGAYLGSARETVASKSVSITYPVLAFSKG